MEEYIRESNLIENIDDPEEDKRSLQAWLWLSQQQELTHGVIRKLQKWITTGQQDLGPNQRGYYRGEVGNNINVTIGGRVGADYRLVRWLMDNWLLDFMKMDPLTAHIKFEKIHPFVDGNGRTGRMLMWWHQIKLDSKPVLFRNDEKHDIYYQLFD
jgi:Fic family protein